MSEKTESNESNLESKENQRIYWLDHARGFIMIFLVVTMFLPKFIRTANPIAHFFLEHPENSTTAAYMNFYDLGAPVFILIMGLLMPISFHKRKEREGTSTAIKHLLIRYCFLLGLGLLVFIVDGGYFIKVENGEPVIIAGIPVIRWDVIPTLGLVGIVAIPFLFVKPSLRAGLATIMLLFYQTMLIYGGWRDYAIASIHGGILGTIFGFSALMIFATCCGEFLFMNEQYSEKQRYTIFGLIGAFCFIGGVLLSYTPEWYANKRQVTFTYTIISAASAILLSFIFIAIDKKYQKPIPGWDGYGKNFLITYLIAVVIEFLIVDIIGYEIDLLIGISVILGITIFVLYLDKKNIVIKL